MAEEGWVTLPTQVSSPEDDRESYDMLDDERDLGVTAATGVTAAMGVIAGSVDHLAEVKELDMIMSQWDLAGDTLHSHSTENSYIPPSLPNASVQLLRSQTNTEYDITADLSANEAGQRHSKPQAVSESVDEAKRVPQYPPPSLPQPKQRPVPAPRRRASGAMSASTYVSPLTSPEPSQANHLMSQSVSALSHTASSTDNPTSSVSALNTSRRSYYSSTSESGTSVSTTQPDSVPEVQAQSNTFNSASMGGGGDAGSLNSGTATSTAANEQEANKLFRVYLQKAKLKEESGRLSDAITEYSKALSYEIQWRGALHPEVVKTHCVLSRLYRRNNQPHQAVEVLEKELAALSRGKVSSEQNPDMFWPLHDALAQSYGSTGKAEKKIEHYELAICILSNYTAPPERLPHMHNNLGNSYRDYGDLNSAREHLEKARTMMELVHGDSKIEEMAKVHASLGDVYADLGCSKEAIDELEKAIVIREHLNPGPAGELIRGKTHKTLAGLYQKIGNHANAARQEEICKRGLEAALSSGKDRDSILQQLKRDKNSGSPASAGELGKLAAHIQASDDISKAQQCQKINDHAAAIEHYIKAIESIMSIPHDLRQTEQVLATLSLCHNNVGNSYRRVSKFPDAKTHLVKALEIRRQLYADEANDDTASTLYNIGHLLSRMGGRENMRDTVKYHEECVSMYRRLGGVKQHMNWIISLYRSLGSTYEKLENSRKSVENYEKAKDILIDNNGDRDELRAIYNNMGNSYESLSNFPKAEEYLNKSLVLAQELLSNRPEDFELKNHVAACYNNLGVMYQTMGQLEKSLDLLNKSREIRQSISDKNEEAAQDLASSYHNLGNTLAKMEKYADALDMYMKEKDLRRMMGQDLTSLAVVLSHMYSKMGDMTRAEEILDELAL